MKEQKLKEMKDLSKWDLLKLKLMAKRMSKKNLSNDTLLEKIARKTGVSMSVWREIAKDQTDEFMLKHPHLTKTMGRLNVPVNKETIAEARRKYDEHEKKKEEKK